MGQITFPAIIILLCSIWPVSLSTNPHDSVNEPLLPICHGACVSKDTPCNATTDESNCGTLAKCCLDGLDSSTDPGELSSLDKHVEQWNSSSETNDTEVHHISATELITEYYVPDELDSTTYYYEEVSDGEPETETGLCPGSCVPTEYSQLCQYVVDQEGLCDETETCCLSESDAARLEVSKGREMTFTEDQADAAEPEECPGTCILPSLVIFCEKISNDYMCPADSKCCLSQVTRLQSESVDQPVTRCAGQCLPPYLQHVCLPPYQLMLETSCKKPMACCMKASEETLISSSSRDRNIPFPRDPLQLKEFPSEQHRQKIRNTDYSYLASDGKGQIFKVGADGQMSPLLNVPQRHNFKHLYDFEQPEGKVSIFEDKFGNLYQQFPAFEPFEPVTSYSEEIPSEHLTRRSGFPSGVSETQQRREPPKVTFEKSTPEPIISLPDDSDDLEESLKDVVIPEEGDTVLKSEIPPGERTMIRPLCPGSCISSFLKFTCFKDHAVYAGFTCPSRSICCASLKDIEEHEEYLRALSPYFTEPATVSERSNLHCGIKGRRESKSSTDALPGEWCWQVAIVNEQNQYICGGSLIDGSWVITAAHCVTGAVRQNQPLFVRAGVTDLTSPSDNAVGQTRSVMSTLVHHDHNSVSLDNNIALLRLQNNFEMNANVCTVCLPTSGQMPSEDVQCTATGYGFVTKRGTMALRIGEAQVNFVDDMDCIANITEALATVFILPDSSFCATGHESGDACQGDSGGPLVCETNGVHELTGILSWGFDCSSNEVPSIFVKVPAFMSWINQIISASDYLKILT